MTQIDSEKLIKMINELQNPYPRDIFPWEQNEKNIELGRFKLFVHDIPWNSKEISKSGGRFNKFIHNIVENTKDDIIKIIKEMEDVGR